MPKSTSSRPPLPAISVQHDFQVLPASTAHDHFCHYTDYSKPQSHTMLHREEEKRHVLRSTGEADHFHSTTQLTHCGSQLDNAQRVCPFPHYDGHPLRTSHYDNSMKGTTAEAHSPFRDAERRGSLKGKDAFPEALTYAGSEEEPTFVTSHVFDEQRMGLAMDELGSQSLRMPVVGHPPTLGLCKGVPLSAVTTYRQQFAGRRSPERVQRIVRKTSSKSNTSSFSPFDHCDVVSRASLHTSCSSPERSPPLRCPPLNKNLNASQTIHHHERGSTSSPSPARKKSLLAVE